MFQKEFFGVYLLIRKLAVLRYNRRLLAVYVSLMANRLVLYHIFVKFQVKSKKMSETRHWIL